MCECATQSYIKRMFQWKCVCVCVCIYNRQKVMGFSLSPHLCCTIFSFRCCWLFRSILSSKFWRAHAHNFNSDFIDENVRFTFTEKRRHHRSRHCDSASSSSNHRIGCSIAHWILAAEWIWCWMHSVLHSDSAMHSTVICHIETKLAASPTKWFVWCLNAIYAK